VRIGGSVLIICRPIRRSGHQLRLARRERAVARPGRRIRRGLSARTTRPGVGEWWAGPLATSSRNRDWCRPARRRRAAESAYALRGSDAGRLMARSGL